MVWPWAGRGIANRAAATIPSIAHVAAARGREIRARTLAPEEYVRCFETAAIPPSVVADEVSTRNGKRADWARAAAMHAGALS